MAELLSHETGRPVDLPFGAFGENLTIEGLLETEVFVGDQLIIGGINCSVVKLREPCFKFNAKMDYKGAAKTMLQSGFSGWYLRVNQVGILAAGAAIHIIPGNRETSIAEQNQDLLRRGKHKGLWE